MTVISNEEYHADPAISASQLKEIGKSPFHYWKRYVDPDRSPSEPTAAMRLGSLVHCAVLEPNAIAAVRVDGDLSGSTYRFQ